MHAWSLFLCVVIAIPSQSQTGSISGIVKDSAGARLAGVTVEVSSPALIEKMRSAVTDDDGAYTIVGLQSGTYLLTFTIPGFSSLKREAIEVTSS